MPLVLGKYPADILQKITTSSLHSGALMRPENNAVCSSNTCLLPLAKKESCTVRPLGYCGGPQFIDTIAQDH
jgi:hypothetical protein